MTLDSTVLNAYIVVIIHIFSLVSGGMFSVGSRNTWKKYDIRVRFISQIHRQPKNRHPHYWNLERHVSQSYQIVPPPPHHHTPGHLYQILSGSGRRLGAQLCRRYFLSSILVLFDSIDPSSGCARKGCALGFSRLHSG